MTESLSSDSAGLLAQISLLQSRLTTLLDTPTPAPLAASAGAHPGGVQEPWAASRSAFVNWAAAGKVAALGRGGAEGAGAGAKAEDAGLARLQEQSRRVGRGEDAQVS